MLGDAISTGKPTYVYAPETTVEDRHRRFILNMIDSGRLQWLGDSSNGIPDVPSYAQDEIRDAVEIRRQNIKNGPCDKILNWAKRLLPAK